MQMLHYLHFFQRRLTFMFAGRHATVFPVYKKHLRTIDRGSQSKQFVLKYNLLSIVLPYPLDCCVCNIYKGI